jgi:quercetin dioxygenase-like cupin family protein
MSRIQEKDDSAVRQEQQGATKQLGSAPGGKIQPVSGHVGAFCCGFNSSHAEVRELPKCTVKNVQLKRGTVGMATFKPGWKWSTDLKPIVKTHDCEQYHLGLVLKGSMVIQMADGTQLTGKAGDAFFIPPHHDGWVTGNEDAVVIDVQGFATFGIQQTGEKDVGAQHELKNLQLSVKSFDHPDETKQLPNCQLDLVKFGDVAAIGKFKVLPGWRWSKDIKPLVGTDYCEHSHMGIAIGGKHTVKMRDGTQVTMDATQEVQVCEVEPGHDGWLEGNSEGILYDITNGVKHYGDHKKQE